MAIEKQALRILKSGMVLDRLVLAGRSCDEISNVLSVIRNSPGARLRVVDDADQFFTADKLMELIRAKDMDYMMIAEQAGIQIPVETVDVIWKADAITTTIKKQMTPKYVLADVPEGWSIGADISFGHTIIRRKRTNLQGDNNTYTISPKRLEILWGVASLYWAKIAGATDNGGIVESQGTRRVATINVDRIVIGCQIVRRYEVEQIAKHRGWAFPLA